MRPLQFKNEGLKQPSNIALKALFIDDEIPSGVTYIIKNGVCVSTSLNKR